MRASRKCETPDACVQPVKGRADLWRAEENRSWLRFWRPVPAAVSAPWTRQHQNPPHQPQSGTWGCETGFGRGFSQLTFSVERGEYQPSGFPTQPQLLSSRCALGMQNKETCEEKQMNKADLVDKIAGACEISKAQAATAIDTAVSSITGARS